MDDALVAPDRRLLDVDLDDARAGADEPAVARLIGEETRVNTDDRQYFENRAAREERLDRKSVV